MTARLPVSRQLPTAMESVISGEDALLLQYLYTLEKIPIAAFARRFACEYGLSITSPALRSALLAAAAYRLLEKDGSSFRATYQKQLSAARPSYTCFT